MEIEKDWFMRQIQQLAQFVAQTFFQKDLIRYEIIDEVALSQTDLLYNTIKRLITEMKICEAENLLFERLDTGDLRHLELAIDFYQTVNLLSDEELKNANFSREEIQAGLREILNRFKLPDFGL